MFSFTESVVDDAAFAWWTAWLRDQAPACASRRRDAVGRRAGDRAVGAVCRAYGNCSKNAAVQLGKLGSVNYFPERK
jgi:hypothetical protein